MNRATTKILFFVSLLTILATSQNAFCAYLHGRDASGEAYADHKKQQDARQAQLRQERETRQRREEHNMGFYRELAQIKESKKKLEQKKREKEAMEEAMAVVAKNEHDQELQQLQADAALAKKLANQSKGDEVLSQLANFFIGKSGK